MRLLCVCMAFISWLGFASAWAAEETSNSVLDKRITIYGGIRYYQASGTFKSTAEGQPEINVDMDDLGLNENDVVPIAGAMLNFGKRWSLRFDYFGFHDDAEKTADFSFDFDGVVIPVGARVDSSLDLDLYVFNLAYNLIHTERARFGVGLGFHATDFDLKISGTVTVAGSKVSLGEGQEDFFAPLPNLYAYGAYAIMENFIFRYGGGWMSLSYGDYDGSLLFANASFEYWPFQYAGFGLGYNYIAVDVDYDPDNKKENYEVDLPGIILFMKFGF